MNNKKECPIKYRVHLNKSADYKDVLTYEGLRMGNIFKGKGKIWKVTKVYADGSLQVIEIPRRI